jgi:hypothetical protein
MGLFENLELDSGACPGLDPGFAGETNIIRNPQLAIRNCHRE